MMVSQPSGRCGPCCSVVPTGTTMVGPLQQPLPHRTGGHLLQAPGASGLSHRAWSWVVVVRRRGGGGGGVAARPAWVWVAAAAVALGGRAAAAPAARGLAAARAGRRRWRGWSAAMVVAQGQLASIEHHWPEQRQRRDRGGLAAPGGGSSCRLPSRRAPGGGGRRDRGAATGKTRVRGARSAGARGRARDERRHSRRRRDCRGPGPAATGSPRPPRGDSIGSRATGYYVELEARRHTAGRTGRGGRGPHLGPSRGARTAAGAWPSCSARGPRSASAVYPPNTAPDSADVFDYEEPTTAGPRLLFSVRPIPPEQGTAKELAYERGSRAVTWLVLAVLALGLSARSAADGADRAARDPALAGGPRAGRAGARAPAAVLPGYVLRPLLGPLSGSAGVLALAGMLLTIGGVWLWRQRLPRRWYGVALGGALLLVSPYLISSLGRGITPPADGVSIGLWLIWHARAAGSASALIVPTAALFRGPEAERPRLAAHRARGGASRWRPRSSGCWSGVRAAVGRTGTPSSGRRRCFSSRCRRRAGPLSPGSRSWLAARRPWSPGARSWRERCRWPSATWPGSATSPTRWPCRSWSASATRLRRAAAPQTASEMYALWHGSALGLAGLPGASRAVVRHGALIDELVLDSLDLPPSLLVDHGAGPPARRLAAGRAGAARARGALRPPGAGRRRRGHDGGRRAALGARAARPGRAPARPRQPADAALSPHPEPAGRSVGGHAALAVAAGGLVGAERVSAGPARRPADGARGDRPPRARSRSSSGACWSCCSTRPCWDCCGSSPS